MVLLTGATGFVGKNFVLEYVKEAPIRILVRPTSDISLFKNNPAIDITYGHLTDHRYLDKALDGIDLVIHCASLTNGRKFYEFYCSNTLSTMYLVQAMKRKKIDKLLFISSQSACGPGKSGIITNKSETSCPVSFYGISKKMAEDVVIGSGLQYIILRPSAVYGPYDTEILKYLRLLKNGIYPTIGKADKYTSFIYVKDFVSLLKLIVYRSYFDKKIYFVSDGICYQHDKVVDEICRILKKPSCIKLEIPLSLAYLFGLLNDLFLSKKMRLIGFDKIRDMSKSFWVCENTRIMNELEWKPAYDFKKGMEETIKWYRENGYLNS